MTSSATQNQAGAPGGKRVLAQVTSLAELVGAHPDALRSIYATGRPADPAELGDAPSGRVLTVVPGSSVFLAMRPLVRAMASSAFPWKGKTFDHGGNSGTNRVLGKQVFRFRAERAESWIDAGPTLRLSYGDEAFGNPWPVRALVDELRAVGVGIAIGPGFYASAEDRTLLGWFGLEASR